MILLPHNFASAAQLMKQAKSVALDLTNTLLVADAK